MKNLSFIAVSGFFSSGSSAAVDLLKEYSGVYECEPEIRIIRDPYGISQLERALTDNWELLNSSAAIRDFLWLCKKCAKRKNNPFSPAGLSYAKKINPDFMELTRQYIDALTDFQYQSDFIYQKFKKNYFHFVLDRWRMGLESYSRGLLKTANRSNAPAYFAHPDEEKFIETTRDYLERVFENCADPFYGGRIILDQAISPNDADAARRYFRDVKLIIVDRDPRDMYVEDIVRWRENLDRDVSSREAGEKYVMRHKALRQSLPQNDPLVLMINFEDLILDYDASVEKIERFLGLDAGEHKDKGKYLKTSRSAKNIGVYKKYYERYRDALDAIAEELPLYCREGNGEQ